MSRYDKHNFIFKHIDNFGLLQKEVDKVRKETTLDGVKELLDEGIADLTTFKHPEVLRKAIDIADTFADKIALGGAFKKAKLEITSNTNAIFDFSLASNGLFRPIEFYSPSLKEEHPNEFASEGMISGLVPPNLIREMGFDDNKKYYYDRDGQTYICERRQEGTTDVLNNSDAETTIANSLIIPTITKTKDGKHSLKFRSRNKKCYVTFKKIGGGKPLYLDLFIPAQNLNLTKIESVVFGMPMIIVARILESAGIKTKISFIRWQEHYLDIGGKAAVGFSIGVKDYGEPLDVKKLSVLTQSNVNSTLFGTSYYKGFMLDVGNKIGKNISSFVGYGNAPYSNDYGEMDDWMKRYFTFLQQSAKKGTSYSKIEDSRMLLFGSAHRYTMYYSKTMEKEPKEFEKYLMKDVYSILDVVDMAVNPVSDSVPRIVDRLKEDGESDREIREYITNLLLKSNYIPKEGEYAYPKSEQEELQRDKEEKLEELNKYLK